MRISDKLLICEGVECNPDLAEIDHLNELVEGGRFAAKQYTKDRMKELRYRVHEPVDSGEIWDVRIGWCRRWRCLKCGHVRRF